MDDLSLDDALPCVPRHRIEWLAHLILSDEGRQYAHEWLDWLAANPDDPFWCPDWGFPETPFSDP